MAKVNANLADVSTKRQLALPDTYRLTIEKVIEKTENGRQNFNFEFRITEGEFKGLPIFHNVSMHKKNGEPNQVGEADFKRIAEAALGIDPDDTTYDWKNLDSDDLLKREIQADVVIERWVKDQGQPTEKKGESNKIEPRTVSPVR